MFKNACVKTLVGQTKDRESRADNKKRNDWTKVIESTFIKIVTLSYLFSHFLCIHLTYFVKYVFATYIIFALIPEYPVKNYVLKIIKEICNNQ